MFSRNKIMLVKGVFDFIQRNADLSKYELRVRTVIKTCALAQTAYALPQPREVRTVFQLVKAGSLFKTEVWRFEWFDGFYDVIELPDALCNQFVQKRLMCDRTEKETQQSLNLEVVPA